MDEDDQMVETLLGELGSNTIPSNPFSGGRKKNAQRRGSGFILGDLKDPDMSLIEKAEDDDPNQLFSLRAAIVNVPEETSNERD